MMALQEYKLSLQKAKEEVVTVIEMVESGNFVAEGKKPDLIHNLPFILASCIA
jgi:hypothetical protein